MKSYAILATLALVGACGEPPTATPPVSLPTLTLPQMTLSVKADAASNVFVPRAALVTRGGIPGVFVRQDNLARFRMVRVGATRGERVEIVSGLRGDETLVLGDLGAVHDGSPLTNAKN